jgi:1-acyl-sn-glycerol-3-phosphate acyltransferase
MSRLTDIKLIGGWVRWFDTRVGDVGVKDAVTEVMNRTRSKLLVNYLGDSENILKNQPVIVVANHPHESDVLAILGSLPLRTDFGMIANSVLRGIGDNLDKFIIPVYIHHRIENKSVRDEVKIKIFGKIHTSARLETEDEKTKNRASIAKAGLSLDQGGSVLIFPMGGSRDGSWFSGVGHMWRQTKKPETIKVVMAKIEGTSEWDYLRLIPGISYFLPKFKVTFSPSYGWDKAKNEDAKEITKKMENIYCQWTKSLEN